MAPVFEHFCPPNRVPHVHPDDGAVWEHITYFEVEAYWREVSPCEDACVWRGYVRGTCWGESWTCVRKACVREVPCVRETHICDMSFPDSPFPPPYPLVWCLSMGLSGPEWSWGQLRGGLLA